MQNMQQKGLTLRYRNTGSEVIKVETLLVIGDCVGVATTSISPDAEGALAMEGVFTLPKAAGQAISQGQRVYVDNALKITSTQTDDSVSAGIAWAEAVAGDLKVPVKINR